VAKVGDRVRLIYTSDVHTRLEKGTEGTVSFIDAFGTVHINWDGGSTLGMIPGEDSFEVLPAKSY
jgi:hypothetical protein